MRILGTFLLLFLAINLFSQSGNYRHLVIEQYVERRNGRLMEEGLVSDHYTVYEIKFPYKVFARPVEKRVFIDNRNKSHKGLIGIERGEKPDQLRFFYSTEYTTEDHLDGLDTLLRREGLINTYPPKYLTKKY